MATRNQPLETTLGVVSDQRHTSTPTNQTLPGSYAPSGVMAATSEPLLLSPVGQVLEKDFIRETHEFASQINSQDKIPIFIPVAAGEKPGQMSEVTINGYTWKFPKGVFVPVPESVYLVLLQAGKIMPQRVGDEKHYPHQDDLIYRASNNLPMNL